jgi:hypothetical protein
VNHTRSLPSRHAHPTIENQQTSHLGSVRRSLRLSLRRPPTDLPPMTGAASKHRPPRTALSARTSSFPPKNAACRTRKSVSTVRRRRSRTELLGVRVALIRKVGGDFERIGVLPRPMAWVGLRGLTVRVVGFEVRIMCDLWDDDPGYFEWVFSLIARILVEKS